MRERIVGNKEIRVELYKAFQVEHHAIPLERVIR